MNEVIFIFLVIPAVVTACMYIGYLCGLTDAKRAAEKRNICNCKKARVRISGGASIGPPLEIPHHPPRRR